MAHATLHPTFTGLRGKIGDLVYKRYGDKTVVTRVPKFSGKWSKAQKAGRRRFRLASDYAQNVRADPLLNALYLRVAKKRKTTTRAVAIRDYLTAPKIHRIDVRGYQGRVGDRISILASDDFEVVTVNVVIRASTGEIIEQGVVTKREFWVYTATRSLRPNERVTIEVTATDRPRNKTTQVVEWPVGRGPT
jgi:hypothetical protein